MLPGWHRPRRQHHTWPTPAQQPQQPEQQQQRQRVQPPPRQVPPQPPRRHQRAPRRQPPPWRRRPCAHACGPRRCPRRPRRPRRPPQWRARVPPPHDHASGQTSLARGGGVRGKGRRGGEGRGGGVHWRKRGVVWPPSTGAPRREGPTHAGNSSQGWPRSGVAFITNAMKCMETNGESAGQAGERGSGGGGEPTLCPRRRLSPPRKTHPTQGLGNGWGRVSCHPAPHLAITRGQETRRGTCVTECSIAARLQRRGHTPKMHVAPSRRRPTPQGCRPTHAPSLRSTAPTLPRLTPGSLHGLGDAAAGLVGLQRQGDQGLVAHHANVLPQQRHQVDEVLQAAAGAAKYDTTKAASTDS